MRDLLDTDIGSNAIQQRPAQVVARLRGRAGQAVGISSIRVAEPFLGPAQSASGNNLAALRQASNHPLPPIQPGKRRRG